MLIVAQNVLDSETCCFESYKRLLRILVLSSTFALVVKLLAYRGKFPTTHASLDKILTEILERLCSSSLLSFGYTQDKHATCTVSVNSSRTDNIKVCLLFCEILDMHPSGYPLFVSQREEQYNGCVCVCVCGIQLVNLVPS